MKSKGLDPETCSTKEKNKKIRWSRFQSVRSFSLSQNGPVWQIVSHITNAMKLFINHIVLKRSFIQPANDAASKPFRVQPRQLV